MTSEAFSTLKIRTTKGTMSSSSRACFSDGFLASRQGHHRMQHLEADETHLRNQILNFERGYFEAQLPCCHVSSCEPMVFDTPPNGFFASQGCHNGKSQYVQWAQLKHETLNWKDSMDEFSSSRKPIKPQEIVWFFLYHIKHIVWGHLMLSFG